MCIRYVKGSTPTIPTPPGASPGLSHVIYVSIMHKYVDVKCMCKTHRIYQLNSF